MVAGYESTQHFVVLVQPKEIWLWLEVLLLYV
ncbi:hypothetical protein [Klebsiella phage VLC4]|uniref:Uncharacterized protein n=1 Tax=Klebsiella phage VLC4 TaxID=2686207 RepID=A0A6B9I806_9CAUD|nr:hypothetical protein [Klebsiella phage VLC4]DAL65548.1 MAG TPA_asm: hypothetical protein [Caudoviricetes sp.]